MYFKDLRIQSARTADLSRNGRKFNALREKETAGGSFFVTPKFEKTDCRPLGHINGHI